MDPLPCKKIRFQPFRFPNDRHFTVNFKINKNMAKEIELVGLKNDANGRSCERHEVCGAVVMVGDVLRLKRAVVTIDGRIEEALKFVSIVSGREKCIVGYTNKSLVLNYQSKANKFVSVIRLYKDSDNSMERRKSHQNLGMALCGFIPNVQGIQSEE